MCVQAIVNGAIPVVGEGVNETVDFGFSNKVELTGTAQWGKASAKILDNLEDWTDKVLTEGFANVDTVIMGKDPFRRPLRRCFAAVHTLSGLPFHQHICRGDVVEVPLRNIGIFLM